MREPDPAQGGRLGTIVAARRPLREVLEQAVLVESLGYESIWVSEGAGRDALTTAAVLAGGTSSIGLATGVIPLPLRTPVTMAMGAAAVAEASGGRFRLGVGVGHRETVGPWYGAGAPTSVARVADYLARTRALLAGDEVEEFRLRGVKLEQPPPLLLAAMSSRLLSLAGRHAEGVVLNWVTPRRVAEIVAELAADRDSAGAPVDVAGSFEIACYVPVCVTTEVDAARAQLARQLRAYGSLAAYRLSLRRSGLGEDADRIESGEPPSTAALDALGAIGPLEAVQRRLGEFRSAGVTLPVLAPVPLPRSGWESMVATWSALAPR